MLLILWTAFWGTKSSSVSIPALCAFEIIALISASLGVLGGGVLALAGSGAAGALVDVAAGVDLVLAGAGAVAGWFSGMFVLVDGCLDAGGAGAGAGAV